MENLQDAKAKLVEDFVLLKRTNSELIKDLSEYGIKQNKMDIVFMQNLTLSQCIDILKQVRDLALTDENFESLNQSQSLENINGVQANLDIQIRHHKEVRNLFDYYISSN